MMTLREYRLLLVDRFLRWRYRQQDQSTGINYSNGSAIIMFHHVGISKPKGVSASCFSTIDDFNSLIDTLLKSKQIVSLGTLVREIKSGVVPKNHIVLTFDDVPYDFFSNAAPILHKKQIPYTLYVATSLIDTDGYLTTDQLRQLSRNPLCTVGSHTVNHVKVREKGVDFISEIKDSKTILSGLTGKEVEHFAFPYGTPFAVSSKQVNQMKESQLYTSAVSTIPGYINKKSVQNMYFLPRIHSELFIKEFLNK